MRAEQAVAAALSEGISSALDAFLDEARWLQTASDKMEKKGTKGVFGAKAAAAGMSTSAYANKIMSAPEGTYPGGLRKQANFARNAIRISRRRG